MKEENESLGMKAAKTAVIVYLLVMLLDWMFSCVLGVFTLCWILSFAGWLFPMVVIGNLCGFGPDTGLWIMAVLAVITSIFMTAPLVAKDRAQYPDNPMPFWYGTSVASKQRPPGTQQESSFAKQSREWNRTYAMMQPWERTLSKIMLGIMVSVLLVLYYIAVNNGIL
jgi:hypothetical protein